MEFLDNTGHIFTLASYSQKPIGHEYDENEYIFWVNDPTENFLSINNYYMKPVYALIDLEKFGMVTQSNSPKYYQKVNLDKELKITIEVNSNVYSLIGSTHVQEQVSASEHINDLVDLSDDSIKKQVLTNEDLLFVKTEGSYNSNNVPFAIVPFYVLANSENEGVWLSNILIHVHGIEDEVDEYCSITVGGEYKDNYEELMINAQNMGVYLPKNIIKSIYNTSYYNNEFNEVIFNQKIKEYMMNYMNIRGEQGNFKSIIDSLNWFGWGDRIEMSKLLKTDNEFKTQYFLDYFDINTDVIESFSLFKNTAYISLKVKITADTGDYYKRNIDRNNKASYLEGEENRITESLLDKQVPVEVGYDQEKFIYMKQYYDFMMAELGLKLSCLKYYYEKYFLPIHVKVHGAYLADKVYANDIKFVTFPKIEMTADNVYLPEDTNEIEFLGQGTHYFVKQYDFFIDDQYNEFNGFLEDKHKDYYYLNDTCVNIPIKFKHHNKQYDCVLILEKEIDNNGNYPYTYTINEPFNYYEVFAYITNDGDVVEYKDILMAYREYPCNGNENYSLYSNNDDLYKKIKNEISRRIEVTSYNLEEFLDSHPGYTKEDVGYNLHKNKNGQYQYTYMGHTIFADDEQESYQTIEIDGNLYTMIVPEGSSVSTNVFFEDNKSFVSYRASQFNIKFKTTNDNIKKIVKYSEAGIATIDKLNMLPHDIRILKYEDRRAYIISHYDDYKWVELINFNYITEEEIFDILYNTKQQNIDYETFVSTTILASTLDTYKLKSLTSYDIYNKLLTIDKYKAGGVYENELYTLDIINKPVWNIKVAKLLNKNATYTLTFDYITNTPAEVVYESHFRFAQKGDHYYKNFIICPRIMKKIDMRYWQDANFRLSLLVNNKWYEYRFTTKMPEPNVQLGRLRYRYWETDENYYSRFSQIKHIEQPSEDSDGEIIFNNFMYEPALVTVNNVNYYEDLLEANANQHIVNYNEETIDLFKSCQDYITFTHEDVDYFVKINKKLIYNGSIIYIPKVALSEEQKTFKEIVIYNVDSNLHALEYFIKYSEFDTYEYKIIDISNKDNYIKAFRIDKTTYKCTNVDHTTYEYQGEKEEYYIREILYNSSTLRDKYKFDMSIPVSDKYLNSICLFDIYKKVKTEQNTLVFNSDVNLSINGILFIHSPFDDKFILSGKQLWNENMNSGEVVDNDGTTYIEGKVDMWHDRWYDFNDEAWKPKAIKKYLYYMYRDPKTGESKATTESQFDSQRYVYFYEGIFNDLKAFQKFIKSNTKFDSYDLYKDDDGTYRVTYDNRIHSFRVQYKIEFVVKEDDKYVVKELDQMTIFKYIADRYYIESSNGKLTNVKMRISLYYNREDNVTNIPVFVDVEQDYYSYKLNGILINEEDIEWINQSQLTYKETLYNYNTTLEDENYREFVDESSENSLVVFNRLQINSNGNYVLYDHNGENGIELTYIYEYRYLDYNGNMIGRDNPIGWWIQLQDITKDENNQLTWDQMEYDLNIQGYYKETVAETKDKATGYVDTVNDDMSRIAEILRANKENLDNATELTEYTYNHDIYIQQDVRNIVNGTYILRWTDAYTGDADAHSNESMKALHDSISICAVVRKLEDGKPVIYTQGRTLPTIETKEQYLIYNENELEFELHDDEYVTIFFIIENGCEEQYDGFWIKPYLTHTIEEFQPIQYSNIAEENEISFDLNGKHYEYGTNQTPETIDLYRRLFKERYIIYRNKNSESISDIIELNYDTFLSNNKEDKENVQKIENLKSNPNSKYIRLYESIIDLSDNDRFQLDYDMYLMHDAEKWYSIFISKQTLDKVDEFSNIYNLKQDPIYVTIGGDEYRFDFVRFENRFLINRYYNEVPESMNAFEDTDIITAQLVNNDRLPVHLDVSAKYRINSLSIGNSLIKEVDSNCEMAIINVPVNDSKYKQGFYKIDVNYSLDGFTQQSYKDTKKFKIYQT